jgi:hypothetical protein
LWNFANDVVTSNITLYAKWIDAVLVSGSNWNTKMRWLVENVQSDNEYIIELDSDENISPITFSYSGKNNVSITLKGIGTKRIINLDTFGISMFRVGVGSGVTLILGDNLDLRGRIWVNSGGNLILNPGAKITNNTVSSSSSDSSNYGGGVHIDSDGTFTMNGGEISGNTASTSSRAMFPYGGGVYVSSGTFTMNGGKISSNTVSSSSSISGSASHGGGGVYMSSGTFTMNGGEISSNTVHSHGGGVSVSGGTFTMSGGEISGNTSGYGYGGGVYMAYNGGGTFTMSGGEISGNTAYSGGGVYVDYNTIINKTGGTIFGYSSGNSKSNTVKDYSGAVQSNRGHAVHVNNPISIYIMGKDTTSGPGDNLSFDNTVTPPRYSGEWDY